MHSIVNCTRSSRFLPIDSTIRNIRWWIDFTGLKSHHWFTQLAIIDHTQLLEWTFCLSLDMSNDIMPSARDPGSPLTDNQVYLLLASSFHMHRIIPTESCAIRWNQSSLSVWKGWGNSNTDQQQRQLGPHHELIHNLSAALLQLSSFHQRHLAKMSQDVERSLGDAAHRLRTTIVRRRLSSLKCSCWWQLHPYKQRVLITERRAFVLSECIHHNSIGADIETWLAFAWSCPVTPPNLTLWAWCLCWILQQYQDKRDAQVFQVAFELSSLVGLIHTRCTGSYSL